MRPWIFLLLLPMAGCLGGSEDVVCDPMATPSIGDSAVYSWSGLVQGTMFTPTIRAATDPWMGGDDFFDVSAGSTAATILVDVNGPSDGPSITYRRDDTGPFATEQFDAAGRLQAVAMNSGTVQWLRLDQADLPALMGAQWTWGLEDERSWVAEFRGHPFLPATDDNMTATVTWELQECQGVLTVGPAMLDGEGTPAVWSGWRTTFDEASLPLRFERASSVGDWITVLERQAFTAGDGDALPAATTSRTEALATVSFEELEVQRPNGFQLTLKEAIQALDSNPIAAAYLASNPDALVRSFVHTPLPGGEWWGIGMFQPGGDQALEASVRAYADGRPTLVDATTMGLSGDVELLDGDIVSLAALATWHAGTTNGIMDSVWCDPQVLFDTCVFGTSEEVAAGFTDGAGPGVVDGAGFAQGYRVGLQSGVVDSVKLG